MAPKPKPRVLNALHGSREPAALVEHGQDAPQDLVAAADAADLATLRTAQKLLRTAMADVEANGLFVTGPRGQRIRNPASIIVGQQQRVIAGITKAMRAKRSDPQAPPMMNGRSGMSPKLAAFLARKPDRLPS